MAPNTGLALLLLFGLAVPASAVSIDWVDIGNPGNAAHTAIMNDGTTGYGAVPYVYQIGRTEVTNAQYTEFLNAVAASDTNGLYSPDMGSTDPGGITRSGGAGSYSYSTISGREHWPVNYVSFWTTLRFANWMQNGQPVGAQDGTTTENGAYTITAQGIADNSITRNPGSTIFLANEDEWYKAAYHNAVGFAATDYYEFPAGSNALMGCAYPATTDPDTANCYDAEAILAGRAYGLVDVGSYTGSVSPWGTFDQGGNVWEWNEAINTAPWRASRGDGFDGIRNGAGPSTPDFRSASHRDGLSPGNADNSLGFRLASIPEPSTGLLLALGVLSLALVPSDRLKP